MRWCRENCPSVGEAVHPIDPFVYVVVGADGSGASGFDAYTIDEHTGKLSAVAGSPFASGAAPDSAAVDASGRFVYVTDHRLPRAKCLPVSPRAAKSEAIADVCPRRSNGRAPDGV